MKKKINTNFSIHSSSVSLLKRCCASEHAAPLEDSFQTLWHTPLRWVPLCLLQAPHTLKRTHTDTRSIYKAKSSLAAPVFGYNTHIFFHLSCCIYPCMHACGCTCVSWTSGVCFSAPTFLHWGWIVWWKVTEWLHKQRLRRCPTERVDERGGWRWYADVVCVCVCGM